jgi:hypothetical protein
MELDIIKALDEKEGIYRPSDSLLTIYEGFKKGIVTIDLLEKSFSSDLQKKHPKGQWRTINGAKVFIDGGKVVAGLEGFNDHIDKFFKEKKGKVESKKKNVKDMSLDELRKESASFDEKIEKEKKRLSGERLTERTDMSDTYFLDKEDKVRSRDVSDELGRKLTKEQGDPKKRIMIKRDLRKRGIDFDQEATMAELEKLSQKQPEKKETVGGKPKGSQLLLDSYKKRGGKLDVGKYNEIYAKISNSKDSESEVANTGVALNYFSNIEEIKDSFKDKFELNSVLEEIHGGATPWVGIEYYKDLGVKIPKDVQDKVDKLKKYSKDKTDKRLSLNDAEKMLGIKEEKEESQTERFSLGKTESVKDIKSNVDKILKDYSGREMAAIQVEKYLNEHIDIAKKYLSENNIKSREDLKKHLKNKQSKLRSGKREKDKAIDKKFQEMKTNQHVENIINQAKKEGAAMDEKVKKYDSDRLKKLYKEDSGKFMSELMGMKDDNPLKKELSDWAGKQHESKPKPKTVKEMSNKEFLSSKNKWGETYDNRLNRFVDHVKGSYGEGKQFKTKEEAVKEVRKMVKSYKGIDDKESKLMSLVADKLEGKEIKKSNTMEPDIIKALGGIEEDNFTEYQETIMKGFDIGIYDEDMLEKAIGHKYFKREPKAGGGYKYYYTEAQYKKERGVDGKSTGVSQQELESQYSKESVKDLAGIAIKLLEIKDKNPLQKKQLAAVKEVIGQKNKEKRESKESGEKQSEGATNSEKAQFHREKMAEYNKKGDGAKYHYHMGKRDMYKKMAEKK